MPDTNTSQPFPPEDVLLRFKPPEMPETERPIQGVAQEYMVVRNPKANSGIYSLGRFCGDKWESPWTDRPIVAELLRQLAAKDALLADAMKNAERLGNEINDLHKMCQAREDLIALRERDIQSLQLSLSQAESNCVLAQTDAKEARKEVAKLKGMLKEATVELLWMPGTTGVDLRTRITEALK